jgi:DNA adenine methylase
MAPSNVYPIRSSTPDGAAPPLLRWAGSKQKLLPILLAQIPDQYGTYFEPFVGSARFFFALNPVKAVLSDLNKELISTYRTLRRYPTQVYQLASSMPCDDVSYYRIRDQHNPDSGNIANAARFIYLNRYCFNGVYRTNRAGHFNVPRGKRVGQFPPLEAFEGCASSLHSAKLLAGDFEAALKLAKDGDFVYLDPPYAKSRGRFRGEYGYKSFTGSDVGRLLESLNVLDKNRVKFLLSYSFCSEIRPAIEKWYSKTLLVKRQVAGFSRHRGNKREVLIANFQFRALPVTR